jgi:hypothetical protein
VLSYLDLATRRALPLSDMLERTMAAFPIPKQPVASLDVRVGASLSRILSLSLALGLSVCLSGLFCRRYALTVGIAKDLPAVCALLEDPTAFPSTQELQMQAVSAKVSKLAAPEGLLVLVTHF